MYDKLAVGTLGAVGTSYALYKLFFPWLTYDFDQIRVNNRFKDIFKQRILAKTYIIDMFEAVVDRNPDKYFLIYNDKMFTYGRVEEEANKIARVAQTWNLQKGDIVALFMHNGPEFVWTLLGLQKLGITASMINYNLRNKPLLHCLRVCDAKAVISSGDMDLVAALQEVKEEITGIPAYVHNVSSADLPANFFSFRELMDGMSNSRIDKSLRKLEDFDPLCYIYTSGTTGMPKPALLSQVKGQLMTGVLRAHANLSADDTVYTCLPMYHSSALYLGLFNVIGNGATMVISKKFSATHFWEECRRHRVTVIQYIGELLRYLLAQPAHQKDGVHSIRVAYGNGLRPDIWEKFQKRFKIPRILEFFAATEGHSGFVNLHNRTGAVGRYSPYMEWNDDDLKLLVKYDMATSKPTRDQNGRCIRVKQGEPGLLLMTFPEYIKPETIYLGRPEEVEQALVRNVCKEGDVFFNFGDILYQDKDYFLYFADRIGDTFRWKGENVSTMEVAHILTSLDFILDANVYGVSISGQDGRAGMACLILEDRETELTPDMRKEVFRRCEEALPKYARPLFLRVQREMILTATMKQRKVELKQDGFDPSKVKDSIYYLDNTLNKYVPLTEQLYYRILTGESKL